MLERLMGLVEGLVCGQGITGKAKYDPAAKAELVRRCCQPGVSVAGMALAHGVNANLLRKWIRKSQQAGDKSAQGAVLLPVRLMPDMSQSLASSPPQSTPAACSEGSIELAFSGNRIILRGAVQASTLWTVMDCLSRRP
jgi:transposase-like protein